MVLRRTWSAIELTEADRERRSRQIVYASIRHKLNHCLYPSDPECERKAIRAHSIQNRGVLNLLAEDGHVSMLEAKPILDDVPEVPDFESVGRNQATTFTGLCGEHDADLFRPIDTDQLDLTDPEHVFLITYRSVLREAHSQLQVARRLSKVLDGLSEIGIPDPVSPSPASAALTMPVAYAFDAYMEKLAYDDLYLRRDFGAIEHQAVTVQVAEPSLAASTVFYPARAGRRTFCTALNVFPKNGRHKALFSYRRENRRIITPLADDLRMMRGEERELAVSRILLSRCENFILRPSLCEEYSRGQREIIRTYFWNKTVADLKGFISKDAESYGDRFDASGADFHGFIDRVYQGDRRLNLFRPQAD